MQRILAGAALICIASAVLVRSQNPVAAPAESSVSQDRRYVLSVDVDLVNVAATVVDESGRYVDGLGAADFQVLEDGQEQKISFFSHDSQVSISLGVLIDTSGSLQDKLRQSLQTVRAIAAALSPGDEMFVINFDSHVQVRQRFTDNPEDMQRALRDMHAHGETAVYDAIAAGAREMQAAKNPKRILLLVSDGFDTKSKITAAQAEDLLRTSDLLFYAIGIDDDNNDASIRRRPRYHIYDYMLGKLAGAGGGRVIRLYTGRTYDLPHLSDLLLGELHQQYTMGYYPTVGPANGNSRNIEVRITRPGARILSQRLHLQRR
jgi:Ca-activated chloride channel family protein